MIDDDDDDSQIGDRDRGWGGGGWRNRKDEIEILHPRRCFNLVSVPGSN